MFQNIASTNNIIQKIQFTIDADLFLAAPSAKLFRGLRPWGGRIVYSETYRISVGDYGGDDDDHDERPCRRRGGREREGRVNGASGRTRSAGLCRLSLPVRRPSLLPHRKRGSGSSLRSFSFPPVPFTALSDSPFLPDEKFAHRTHRRSLIKISILIVRRPPSRADVLAGA